MIQKPKRLAYLFNISNENLIKILDNIESYYYEKRTIKLNKDGTPKFKGGIPQERLLCPSKNPLKQIQSIIKNKMLSNILLPLNVQGGIKKKDNISNAKIHQGKKYHFCTDVSEFFPSINNKMIYKMFIENYFQPDVARILTILTSYKGFLPQGTPTSTHVANLVFLPIDNKLIQFCAEKKIFYTRFIDDLSFSSISDFKVDTFEILNIINKNGFKINHRKTFYKVGSVLITGIWSKNNNLKARDDQKNRLKDPNLKPNQKKGLKSYIKRVENA
jgi:RNA-directed DNA polymerase